MMRRALLLIAALGCTACGSLTGPDVPGRSEVGVDSITPKPTTGSITLIVCVDGVCPDTTGTGT